MKRIRANLEWLATLLIGGAMFVRHGEIAVNFATGAWNLGAFYSAIFDWSSIQAAFLFGVYAFFLARSEPFIQAIASAKAFKILRRYLVRTLYLSMILSVLSLPMLISPIKIGVDYFDLGFVVFWMLSTLLVYTFFCFWKVIRVFGKIERLS